MKFLHIYPNIISQNPYEEVTFRFIGRNSTEHCTLSVDEIGNYFLKTTPGITSEVTIKRDVNYKVALSKVTQNMLHRLENKTNRYTAMHKDSPRVEDMRKNIEDAIKKIHPRKYVRQKCNLSKPRRDEVEEDLSLEAKSLIHNDTPEIKNAQSYVGKHLNKLYEERESLWQEAINLFNKIEDAREKKVNAEYQIEAEKQIEDLRRQLEGNPSIVEPLIESTLKGLSVPYGLDISFGYCSKEHYVDVNIVLADQLSTYGDKASINASNKLSIKSKLVREITTEKTLSALSLVYSVAYRLFNVSANLDYINISLWKNQSAGYLWIYFNRKSLLRNDPQWTDLLADYWTHPNVSNFKYKADSVEIQSISKSVFEGYIKTERTKVSSDSKAKQLCKISMLDAQKLLLHTYQQEIRDAIDTARSLGRDHVYVDIKYFNMLKEILG